jgi:hypothetical protein
MDEEKRYLVECGLDRKMELRILVNQVEIC